MCFLLTIMACFCSGMQGAEDENLSARSARLADGGPGRRMVCRLPCQVRGRHKETRRRFSTSTVFKGDGIRGMLFRDGEAAKGDNGRGKEEENGRDAFLACRYFCAACIERRFLNIAIVSREEFAMLRDMLCLDPSCFECRCVLYLKRRCF